MDDNAKAEIKPAGYHPDDIDVSNLIKRGHAETAQKLAYWLVGILAGSVLLQYTAITILLCLKRSEEIQTIEHLFNSWLPVIAGLASSATTYYLTKDKDR